jgi:hypothetical protein
VVWAFQYKTSVVTELKSQQKNEEKAAERKSAEIQTYFRACVFKPDQVIAMSNLLLFFIDKGISFSSLSSKFLTQFIVSVGGDTSLSTDLIKEHLVVGYYVVFSRERRRW